MQGLTYDAVSESKALTTRWLKIALFNLLLAASIGVLLRYAFVKEVKWLNYKAFQSAHAHLAVLGWGYLAFFALLLSSFARPELIISRAYKTLFYASLFVIILAGFGFAALGNTLIPNAFILVLSILVFVFTYRLFRDSDVDLRSSDSYSFAKAACLFLCLSFIGIYMLIPALLASGAKKILLYYISSQFFIHFQYNGWFTFAVLALLLRLSEEKQIPLDKRKNRNTLYVLSAGVILTFFISLYWGDQSRNWLLWMASLGGLLQAAIIIAYRNYYFRIYKSVSERLNPRFRVLITIALLCFLLKLLMQVIIIVPFIATLAFTIRNYVIAYIHLVFIGMMSLFIFAWALEHKFLTLGKTMQLGIYAWIVGFIMVELVLFVQGTLLWMGKGFITFYYPMLFLFSVLLPLGLLIVTIRNLKYLPFKNNSK